MAARSSNAPPEGKSDAESSGNGPGVARPFPPRRGEQTPEPSELAPEMLTPDEAAQLLRVNRKTIYAAIRAKTLPGVLHLGPRAVRIRRSALLGSVLGQPVGSLNRSGV